MSWFSDLFGVDQEQAIADGAFAGYADAQPEPEPDPMGWAPVCNLCGGAGGVECPAGCGGHAGGLTDCERFGGGGAIPCPACVCNLCFGEGVVPCPAGCKFDEDPDCPFCEGGGAVECPGGCVP